MSSWAKMLLVSSSLLRLYVAVFSWLVYSAYNLILFCLLWNRCNYLFQYIAVLLKTIYTSHVHILFVILLKFCVYVFRNQNIISSLLAHLSRRLTGELLWSQSTPCSSVCRLSTFDNFDIFKITEPILTKHGYGCTNCETLLPMVNTWGQNVVELGPT